MSGNRNVLNFRSLARQITIVENELTSHGEILSSLPSSKVPVIGITGPPGSGKSTLVNALIGQLIDQDKKLAILAIDPSSPFNYGALLGDRIRMNQYFNHPNVFIRSIASRGSLGGLSYKILEVTELVKAAGFDYVFIETVGVGQSEVEIAGLADQVVLVLNPGAGDEIQMFKAGILEIADLFVINKADHDGTEALEKMLQKLIHSHYHENPPAVLKTVATTNQGVEKIIEHLKDPRPDSTKKKKALLLKKAIEIIKNNQIKALDISALEAYISMSIDEGEQNIFYILREIIKK